MFRQGKWEEIGLKEKRYVGSFKLLPLNTTQCEEILKTIQAEWPTNSIAMKTSRVCYFRLNTMCFRFLSLVPTRSLIPLEKTIGYKQKISLSVFIAAL